jgi:hypothetical protein
MWKDHYNTLLNSVKNQSNKQHVTKSLESCKMHHSTTITCNDVASSIKSAKCGKSCGHDLLSSEHFIHANSCISVMLAVFYTSTIVHGHLPDDFMKTIIIPLVKDKTGDISEVNNYRPIALVTATSKVFECILLDKLQQYLESSDNQFGFKKKHSTDQCIYVLKWIVQYYKNHNSPVYSCFLDASKAFDRVNHWTLFNKLVNRGVPSIFVRIIMYWYQTQMFQIKWGSHLSICFNVSNGVRQGGILSPYLFSIYVNDLSVNLTNSKTGCCINNTFVNHIFYADDLCVAPSAKGLQDLIDICMEFGDLNDIIYNPLKSVAMVFKPTRFTLSCPQVSLGQHKLVYKCDVKYLGVFIAQDLCDGKDMLRQMRSLYARATPSCANFLSVRPK